MRTSTRGIHAAGDMYMYVDPACSDHVPDRLFCILKSMLKARLVLGFFWGRGKFWRIVSMFWENTFEVPREMPESTISGACEHNPRTPSHGPLLSKK